MFSILSKTIGNVFSFSLPMIIISVVVVVTLRVADIVKNKKEVCLYKELLALSFIIYILCLFQVVTFQDNNYSSHNLVPFKEILRYNLGSRLFLKNVLGNIIMFLPYGFFTSYYLKEKKVLPILILSFIASISIESTQLMVGRVFDIDDIILNTIGGIIGHYLYCLLLKIGLICPKIFLAQWFLNLLSIIFLIGLVTLL